MLIDCVYFFKGPVLCFIDILYCFGVSSSFNICPRFIISSFLRDLCSFCWPLSSYVFKLLMWVLSSLLMNACIAMYFLLNNTLVVSHKFCLLVSILILIWAHLASEVGNMWYQGSESSKYRSFNPTEWTIFWAPSWFYIK